MPSYQPCKTVWLVVYLLHTTAGLVNLFLNGECLIISIRESSWQLRLFNTCTSFRKFEVTVR
jgi:hypothetical protein